MGVICREDNKRWERSGSTGGAAHEIPGRVECENGARARLDDLTDIARPGGRGYRIAVLFCCGALARDWHKAADRCGAKVQTLSEVKRISCEVIGRVSRT